MAARRCHWSFIGLSSMLAALLSACSQTGPSLPRVLRVARSTSDPGGLNVDETVRSRRVIKQVQALVQEFDPGLHLHPSSFSEANLQREIARQTNSGLGPDLIITNGNSALALLHNKLTDPISLSAEERTQISSLALNRITTAEGQIAGLPVSQYVQLACYDKRRLPEPPESLDALAKASGKGKVFGLAMHLEDLYWTLGGFEATAALQMMLDRGSPSIENKRRLNAWLGWLQNASFQQNVLFLNNQVDLREQLIKGQLDWITCWSSQLPQLRTALKENLGVTTLPRGPVGKATPITRMQVWALGRNSSSRQRADSMRLLAFMVEPWAQKTLSLKYRTSFPINPKVMPIVQRQLATERHLDPAQLELGLTDKPSTHHGNALLSAISSDPRRMTELGNVLNNVIFGTLNTKEASMALEQALAGAKP